MHVALICPFSVGTNRGNITTVRRIAHHLPEAGCQITTLPLDTLQPAEQLSLLRQVQPHLLHAFHAYHSGPSARRLAQVFGIPYLLTITGSDMFDPTMRNDRATRQAIAAAAAVTCFDPLVAHHLTETFSEAKGKITVIPQGVSPLPDNEPFPHAAHEFLILMPAALRPVKGITNALDALTPLAKEFTSLRLILAGGDIDPDYAATIRQRVSCLPWVHMLGDVPHQRMGALYAAADLVLNCSHFEGGMANSLLEAMVMGRPVLARDVLGNRSLIRNGETGWLYGNDTVLGELLRLMLLNPERRLRKMGEAGRSFVQNRYSPLTEARSYATLYERVMRGNFTGADSMSAGWG